MKKKATLELPAGERPEAIDEDAMLTGALSSITPMLGKAVISGTYEWKNTYGILPQLIPSAERIEPALGEEREVTPTRWREGEMEVAEPQGFLFPFRREEVRLDVDGRYPLMVASGTIYAFKRISAHWIAKLHRVDQRTYQGPIFFKEGSVSSIPYSKVQIQVGSNPLLPAAITVTFMGNGVGALARVFRHRSKYYRGVEFEFDSVEGIEPVTTVQTHAHPNRPADLPSETLSIGTVFRRSGFNVQTTPDGLPVPIAGAGANAAWSDTEMHDAMQTYWSRFANAPQWSLWTFFASLHEQGSSLGGIMFDDIGPNHRQGTAIFLDAFISQPPANDPAPDAWVRRMRFWTAVHEMGHSFNLAHSWQKSLGTPWVPLADEPEARSFMNYPYFVGGGQTAFFADFPYRFSDSELLFMRHAPERFVQMGNADWFDHHGFEQAEVTPEPGFQLEIRVNRPQPVFEFLEPVVIELKLTNIAGEPKLIEEHTLQTLDHATVIIKKDGRPAREFMPFAQSCWQQKNIAIDAGQSLYESLFISVGQNGWDLSEPGRYTIQLALHLHDEDIVSNPLQLRVTPPRNYDEEYLAQDFFTEDVGRVLTFDGTRCLTKANDTLREVAKKLADRKVALHARIALGAPAADEFKELDLGKVPANGFTSAQKAGAKIRRRAPDAAEAKKDLGGTLIDKPQEAAETLGHVDYKYYLDKYTDYLAEYGTSRAAGEAQSVLHETLARRNVLGTVLKSIERRRDSLKKK